jgi:hypothetical protein
MRRLAEVQTMRWDARFGFEPEAAPEAGCRIGHGAGD